MTPGEAEPPPSDPQWYEDVGQAMQRLEALGLPRDHPNYGWRLIEVLHELFGWERLRELGAAIFPEEQLADMLDALAERQESRDG